MTSFNLSPPAKFIVLFRQSQMSTSIGVHSARDALDKMMEMANRRGGYLDVVDRDGRSYGMEELAALANSEDQAVA